MDWKSAIFGIVTAFISLVIFNLMPKKWNIWLKGLASFAVVALLSLLIRLIFGPISL